MKKVLIISHSFPPTKNIAAKRFGDIVSHMPEKNWQPWVLTTNYTGEGCPLSEKQMITLGNHPQENTIDVLRRQKLPAPFAYLRKLLGKTSFRLVYLKPDSILWFNEYKRTRMKVLGRLPSLNAVVSSFAPPASFQIGEDIGRTMGIPWIADFRDVIAPRTQGRTAIAVFLDKFMEKRCIRNARALTTVSPTLSKMLSQVYQKECRVIYNGWNSISNPSIDIDAQANLPTFSKPYIYYAGRFFPHRIQGIFILLETLVQFPKFTLVIRSLGPEEINRKIEEKAGKLGVKKRVKIFPPCDTPVVLLESKNAAFNLVVEDLDMKSMWSKGTLTGKFLKLLPLTPPISSHC